MDILYLIFYGCLRLRFLDVETNPDRVVLYLLSADYSVVMCWAGNLSDLTVASSQYDILLCSETLVSDMHHVSEVLVLSPCLVVSGQVASGPWDDCIRSRWLRSISPTQI